jgi:hypothetical protein
MLGVRKREKSVQDIGLNSVVGSCSKERCWMTLVRAAGYRTQIEFQFMT